MVIKLRSGGYVNKELDSRSGGLGGQRGRWVEHEALRGTVVGGLILGLRGTRNIWINSKLTRQPR